MDILEYNKLVEIAKSAGTAYYDNDFPVMEDPEYDKIMSEIKVFERENPSLVRVDSPTLHVGGTPSKSSFEKVTHNVPMLSLQDVFTVDDVTDFLSGAGDEKTLYSVEEKIDGLSMSVVYRNGVLVRAETRGDGIIGEDITENARYVNGIPNVLKSVKGCSDIEEMEVRCEVYLPISEFERINKELHLQEKRLFANPRNAAAGILRTKDISVVKAANLAAFAFNVQRILPEVAATHEPWTVHCLSLNTLQKMGFNPVFHRWVGPEGVADLIREIGERRNSLPYWIDGCVVKVDTISDRVRLGETGKYPKWAIAFKYPPEEKETVVRNIILQTGRTGRITPVAVFDPIFLAGTKVEKATLHNPEQISKLQINIGDTILVRKAAEIIPEIIKVIKPTGDKEGLTSRSTYDIFAHRCPSCGGVIVPGTDENGNNESGAYCTNSDCPAQISRKFEFWASRDCMDIRGFGPAVIDRFIELGWLKSIPDIYRLKNHHEEMMELDGFGRKATDKLLLSIEESKDRDIDRLIKAFGIPGIGRHIGKNLAKKYDSLWTIVLDAALLDLSEIDGVGGVSANVMRDTFKSSEFRNLLKDLNELGVNMMSKSYKPVIKENGKFANLTFVITGTLPTLSRTDAAEFIEKNGGTVSGSVSKKTDYLLCGEKAGSKLDKAKGLGVKVLTEEDLRKML